MKTSRLALVVLAAGLLCVGNAVGQDEKKTESDAAVVLFEETLNMAKAGNAKAMFALGHMYDNGQGVLENDNWYRKAAELIPHPPGHLQTTARNKISYQSTLCVMPRS